MPAPCKICGHPRKPEIEQFLFRNSLRETAAEFGVSVAGLHRHRAHAAAAASNEDADELVRHLHAMVTDLRTIAKAARDGHKWTSAIIALREIRENLTILERLRAMSSFKPIATAEHLSAMSERRLLEKLANDYRQLRETLGPGRCEVLDRLIDGREVPQTIWDAMMEAAPVEMTA